MVGFMNIALAKAIPTRQPQEKSLLFLLDPWPLPIDLGDFQILAAEEMVGVHPHQIDQAASPCPPNSLVEVLSWRLVACCCSVAMVARGVGFPVRGGSEGRQLGRHGRGSVEVGVVEGGRR